MGGMVNAIASYNPVGFNLDNKQKQATLEHTQAQVPLINAQAEEAQAKVREAKRAERDQQILSDAMKASQGDPNKLIEHTIRMGGSPALVMGTQKSIAAMAKERAGVAKEENELHLSQLGQARGGIEAVLALPPEQQQAAYAQLAPSLAGLVDEHERQLLPDPAKYDPKQLEFLGHAISVGGTILDQTIKKQDSDARLAQQTRETNDANAKRPGVVADATMKQTEAAAQQLSTATTKEQYGQLWSEIPAGIARRFPQPEEWGPKLRDSILQVGLTPQQAVTAERAAVPNSPAELAIVAASPDSPPEAKAAATAALKTLEQHQRAGRAVVNVQTAGMPSPTGAGANLTGESYLKTLPSGIASRVRQIAEGRETLNARTPQDIRSAVAQFDPKFSEQRAQIRRAFTTGPDGKNIGALNTAIVHLDRLGQVADALNNGTFTPGNQAYNWLRDKVGSDKVTNFNLLKDAVAGEMAAALKGNATDIEIEKMGKSIRLANSPEQMNGVVSEGMAILNDKANTYNERYRAVVPDDDTWTPILPSARAAMARHTGSGPSIGDTQQHQGATYKFDGKQWVKQ